MYMLIWVGQSYIADTGLLVAHYFMDGNVFVKKIASINNSKR